MLLSLLATFLPVCARASTVAASFAIAPSVIVLAMVLPAKPAMEEMINHATLTRNDPRGDTPIIWLPLPSPCMVAVVPGLLEMNYQELKSNPNMAQATAGRTISTVAALADNYEFPQFADMLRDLNGRQQAIYRRLKDLHQRYIADNHIEIRRTRESGENMYVLGYRGSF